MLAKWKWKGWAKSAAPYTLVFLTVASVAFMIWISQRPSASRGVNLMRSDASGAFTTLFTQDYPAHKRFHDELGLLRTEGKLKTENEILINQSVLGASSTLKMPPAVLWCLLFQESRLNHLEGLHGDTGARGLGQFSSFSFYEVNHHLEKYSPDNMEMMLSLLGKDIRPVEPRVSDLRAHLPIISFQRRSSLPHPI